MKNLAIIAPVLLALAPLAPAAILFSSAPAVAITGGGGGTVLVDTTNDTGDWITAGGYEAGTSSTPLYFQVTMMVTNNAGETGGGGFFTGFQLFKTGTEKFAVGNNWGSVNWGGFNGPGDYDVTGNPAIILNTAVNFVVKLDQAGNTATVYYNPNLSLTEAAQSAGSVSNLTGMGDKDEFNAINIRAGNGTASTTFSNIVVRTDSPFAAVPEPGSALLLGVGALGLIRRRRSC